MLCRALEAEDRGALEEILRRTDNFRPDEVDVALELIDSALTDTGPDRYRVIVARDSERVWGYVCFGRTPMTDHTWDLYWIVVDPAGRGRGIGRELCAALETEVRAEGGITVRLETSSQESYGGTHRFYDALGFAIVGRIADFYRVGDDLLTYTRRLDA